MGNLEKFCHSLITKTGECEVLFDQFFGDYFSQFISDLSESPVLAFRHTGVFLVTKLSISMVKLIKKINGNILQTASQVR